MKRISTFGLGKDGRDMIRVNQIAQELAKLKIPLIAGQAGLDREVRYVTSIELKEKTPRIQEKGFLLSTFHAFEDAEVIVDHLKWLNGIKVSAIGFHTSVYQEIPDHVLDFSETHGLPLFRIPAETPYNLFFELFNDMRQKVRETAMKRLHQLNHVLIEAVLSKQSPGLIIDMIGEHSGGDFVAWLNSHFDVFAQWNGDGIGQPAIQAFIKAVHSSKEKLIQARIQDEPYRLHCDEVMGGFLIAFPVSSQAVFGGYLILHFNEEPDASARLVMTEMIQTASKILTSDVYNPETRIREKEIQIIEQLLFGEADPHLIHELPLDLQNRYRIVLIETEEKEGMEVLAQTHRLFQIRLGEIGQRSNTSISWVRNHQLILVTGTVAVSNGITEIVSTNELLYMGASDWAVISDAKSLRRMYEQASIALKHAMREPLYVVEWNRMGIEKVAVFIEEQALFEGYADNLLTPLIEYDQRKNADLVRTLHVYLINFFNLKKTGEELFVHPNTVKYRIETIKELLPVDFHYPSAYALFILAFQSYIHKIEP